MPNQPKTPMLSVRCDRELRDAARTKAHAEGTTLTAKIVGWMRAYVVGELVDLASRPDHPGHPDKTAKRGAPVKTPVRIPAARASSVRGTEKGTTKDHEFEPIRAGSFTCKHCPRKAAEH